MNKFDDIRPFDDNEVRGVLDRVLENTEFKRVLAKLSFPKLSKLFPALVAPVVGWVVKRELRSANTLKGIQDVEEGYMAKMMANTMDGLSASGTDHLRPDRNYLFVSNHRDIAMDPGFVIWVCFQNKIVTPRLAIGDNLLTKPFASDIMRLNKSFIVNRSATGNKEKYKAMKHLSEYLHFSIVEEKSNIWIAQREGRAKDGIDKTNTATVKMFAMNKSKEQSFADYIRELHIVPVSISYEWDPCDEDKARERYILKNEGEYQKGEQEDVKTIAKGIAGTKGHVHVAFGDELVADFEDADAVAAEIDRQVISNYVLQPSNCFAYKAIHGEVPDVLVVGEEQVSFDEDKFKEQAHFFADRLRQVQPQYRNFVREMYANPVVSKLKLLQSDTTVDDTGLAETMAKPIAKTA